MRLAAAVLVSVFFSVAALSETAHADSIGLGAEQDTQLAGDSLSNNNFGTDEYLITNWSGNLRSVGLIEFDLSSLSGATITSATLGLYHALNNSNGTTYDLFRVTSGWDESTATLDTAPSVDGTAAASLTISDTSSGLFRTWDVTSLVQSWVSGTYTNYGMWIEEVPVAGSGTAYFSSSDTSVSSFRPYLSIEFEPVPEPGTLALMGLGLAAALGIRARRRRHLA